jgi:hypothetical protein
MMLNSVSFTIKHCGYAIYSIWTKLMCLPKLVEVTDNSRKHQLITEFVYVLYITILKD